MGVNDTKEEVKKEVQIEIPEGVKEPEEPKKEDVPPSSVVKSDVKVEGKQKACVVSCPKEKSEIIDKFGKKGRTYQKMERDSKPGFWARVFTRFVGKGTF